MENTYTVNEIMGTSNVRITVEGKVGYKSFNMDADKFNQQLGTFLNSDDNYRLKYLAENAEVHNEGYINPSTL